MQAGKNQAAHVPTAFGSMLQASTYGMTIPEIYGRVQSPLLAIWAANLRQGGSSKKFKQMKKGVTAYVENIDFLLGRNPMLGVLQMWNNGAKVPLNFTSYQQTVTAPGPASVTIPDEHFYAVIGVTLTQDYSAAVDDFGGPGPVTLAGNFEVPLWNQLFAGSDPTDSHDYRSFPFGYRWQPDFGATVYFDQWPRGPLPGGVLTIYYAQVMPATKYHAPAAYLRLAFESILGDGDEYEGFTSQQIKYPMYAGLGSDSIDLGAAGAIPALKAEVQGKWGVYPSGDCDYVDIIEDICKSGITQASLGGHINFGPAQHGVACWDYPGTVQKKQATGDDAGLPPILYDLPNTPGGILVAAAKGASAPSIVSSNAEIWTPVFGDGAPFQVWYATANGGPNRLNTVTISDVGAGAHAAVMEIIPGGIGDTGATFHGALGTAGAVITKNFSDSLWAGFVGVIWSGFAMAPDALPDDAVVVGIYPLANAKFERGYDQCGAMLSANYTPGSAGNMGTMPADGIFHLMVAATMLSGYQPAVPVGAKLWEYLGSANFLAQVMATNSVQSLVPLNTLTVTDVGLAVYYRSATPTIDDALSPPWAVPTGQGVAWAYPSVVRKFGEAEFHSDQPPGGIEFVFDPPDGAFNAVSATAGWTPTLDTTNPVVGVGVGGSDTNAGTGAVNSSVAPGRAAFLLAVPFYESDPPADAVAKWDHISPPNFYAHTPETFQAHGRIVHNPGRYSFRAPGTAMAVGLLSIEPAQPQTFPNPFGGFIDPATRELTRAQCRAAGLWGSLSMNAQKAASDWIRDLAEAADCAPVFSGFNLKLVPRSEVSAAGNGAIYIPPTAAGPVANLDADNGDFVAGPGEPAIKCTRKARTDTDTILQMQHLNRGSDYQQVVTAEPDAAGILKYGVRKKDPSTNNAVVDVAVARSILRIQVRRRGYIEPLTYSFALNARWGFLEAMDLVTLTDRSQGILGVPVRLIETEENENYELSCSAEPFIYGIHAPQALAITDPAPYNPGGEVGTSAGDVNVPLIFEPVPRLCAIQPQAQLWLVISSPAPNYGGCQVYASTDGGASYNPVGGPLAGSATTGELASAWAAAADPDTAHDLAVDLTESRGALASYAVSDEDKFVYPCYVQGSELPIESGGTLEALLPPRAISSNGVMVVVDFGYELMSYATATLTAAYRYTLKATGGNHLRRAVFDAPAAGIGCAHPAGARFALLEPAGTGILKLNMAAVWIGHELLFKVLSFNEFGAAAQSLGDVPAYSYTPSGLAYL